MAILWEDNLVGTPTSGTPSPTNHPWAWAFNSAAYTEDTVAGLRALSFGPGYADARVDITSIPTFRLRWYGQYSGTQTAHHFLTRLTDEDVTILADSQIRNVAGPPVQNRWNFVSGGATSAWAQNTPWRFEYRYEAGVGSLLEIWADPDDDGEPDWAITANGVPSSPAIVFAFGNANTSSGLTHLMAALAMSDGPRIGPYVAPPPPSGVAIRGVIQDGLLVPAALRGVIQGGLVVPASLRGVVRDGGLVGGGEEPPLELPSAPSVEFQSAPDALSTPTWSLDIAEEIPAGRLVVISAVLLTTVAYQVPAITDSKGHTWTISSGQRDDTSTQGILAYTVLDSPLTEEDSITFTATGRDISRVAVSVLAWDWEFSSVVQGAWNNVQGTSQVSGSNDVEGEAVLVGCHAMTNPGRTTTVGSPWVALDKVQNEGTGGRAVQTAWRTVTPSADDVVYDVGYNTGGGGVTSWLAFVR